MNADAYPEWPCPYCGHTAWRALFAKPPRHAERLAPVVCGHCNVLFNANWVDGCWMGRMREAEWPGALAAFVEMKAEVLRGERE